MVRRSFRLTKLALLFNCLRTTPSRFAFEVRRRFALPSGVLVSKRLHRYAILGQNSMGGPHGRVVEIGGFRGRGEGPHVGRLQRSGARRFLSRSVCHRHARCAYTKVPPVRTPAVLLHRIVDRRLDSFAESVPARHERRSGHTFLP